MHTQKLRAVICVAALVGAISLNVQGADTDAQARARELMRQKMAELDAAQPGTAPAAVPAQPAPVNPPPVVAPVVVAPDAATYQTPPPSVSVKVSQEPVSPPAAVIPIPSDNAVNTGTIRLTPEQEEKVREAMRLEKAKLDAADQAALAASKNNAPVVVVKKVSAKSSGAYDTGTPMPMPTTMIPGSKEQRLYDLLQLYKADRITPAEYHQQRAKILAE